MEESMIFMENMRLSKIGMIVMLVTLLLCTSCEKSVEAQSGQNSGHLNVNNTVGDIVNHSAFSGFGERLLTRDDNSSYYNPRSGKDCSWN
jgi:hypothetical protein